MWLLHIGDTSLAGFLAAEGLDDPYRRTAPLAVLLAATNSFVAYLVGGLIARERFALFAPALETVLLLINLSAWADWLDRSLAAELAANWLPSLACVAMATVGAFAGVRAARRLFTASVAATARPPD
jgi:hypothetical protein